MKIIDTQASSPSLVSINKGPALRRCSTTSTVCSTSSDPESPAATKKRASPRRNVSFGKVQTREFERVLGINPPSCATGPSLSLGWQYHDKKDKSLQAIELRGAFKKVGRILANGSSTTSKQEKMESISMSPDKREKLASHWGYDQQAIKQNKKQIAKIIYQRERTVEAIMYQSPYSTTCDAEDDWNQDPMAIMEQALKGHGYSKR